MIAGEGLRNSPQVKVLLQGHDRVQTEEFARAHALGQWRQFMLCGIFDAAAGT
jgi:hypothetical protein